MSNTYLYVKSDGNVSRVNITYEPYDNFNDSVHKLINCSIYELVHLPGDFYLIIDELGKCYDVPKAVNIKASMLYPGTSYGDCIVGDVLVGKLGTVNGEPDMVGLAEGELVMLEEFFSRVEKINSNYRENRDKEKETVK